MRRTLRRQLESRRRELIDRIREKLAENLSADVSDDLGRVKTLDQLLEHMPLPIGRRLLGPSIMALLCVAVAWAAWTMTIDKLGLRTEIALSLIAGTVTMSMAGGWQLQDSIKLTAQEVRIDNAALTFSNPDLAFGALPEGSRVQVEILRPRRNASLALEALAFEPGTVVEFERIEATRLEGALFGAASGEFLVSGNAILGWEAADGAGPQSASLVLDFPEILAFTREPGPGVATRISFGPDDQLSLRDLNVAEIRFGRLASGDSGRQAFISTVREGSIRLLDMDQTDDIFAGDSLLLQGLRGDVRELRIGEEGEIAIRLEGSVERLEVGPRGRERELTPNLLAYLQQSHPLTFLFTAASFLWGALWSLRGLLA